MAKVRMTVTLDVDVLRAVKLRAARTGKRDSDVIEEALRRQLSIDLSPKIWENATMDPNEAMALALKAQRQAREQLRKERKASV